MKNTFLLFTIFTLATAACSLTLKSVPTPLPTVASTPVLAQNSPIPPTATSLPPTATSIPATPTQSFEGMPVTFGPLSMVLPPGLASGASGSQFPRAEGDSVSPWEVTPGHIRLDLQGYPLQGKTHQPQIFVYPAQMLPDKFQIPCF